MSGIESKVLKIYIEAFQSSEDNPHNEEDWREFTELMSNVARLRFEEEGLVLRTVRFVKKPADLILIRRSLGDRLASDTFVEIEASMRLRPGQTDHGLDSAWGFAYGGTRICMQVLVIAMIARPDADLGPVGIAIICDGKKIWSRHRNGMLPEYISYGAKNTWPVFERLSMQEVWNWASALEGFIQGRSKTRVGRALICFTQLHFPFDMREDYMRLIWSMIGLEALTNTGPSGAQASFYVRISAMLGEPSHSRKKIKNLYRERSKLLHGQYDLPSQFGRASDNFDVATYPDELYDAQSFAAAILLGALQYCAKRNLVDISYALTIKEIRAKS